MATKKQAVIVKKVSKSAAKPKKMNLKDTQIIAPMFTVKSLFSLMEEKLVTAAS